MKLEPLDILETHRLAEAHKRHSIPAKPCAPQDRHGDVKREDVSGGRTALRLDAAMSMQDPVSRSASSS